MCNHHVLLCGPPRLQQELELQQHSLQLLSERMAGSEGHQLAEALAATEAALQEAQEQAAAAAQKKKEMVALAKVRKGVAASGSIVCREGGREGWRDYVSMVLNSYLRPASACA